MARVVGNPYLKNTPESLQQRSVYFLSQESTFSQPLPDGPLNYSNVQVARAVYDPKTGLGDTFDLVAWTGSGIDPYTISATAGVLSPAVY